MEPIVLKFGKFKGVRITRVPVGYLTWMVGCGHEMAKEAQAELDRRGTTLPTMDVSGHAIDRASQKCLDIWQRTRIGDEGISSWLHRVAALAMAGGFENDQTVWYEGMGFIFTSDCEWPVLKTVVRGYQRS